MRIGVVKQQIAQALGGQKQLSLQSSPIYGGQAYKISGFKATSKLVRSMLDLKLVDESIYPDDTKVIFERFENIDDFELSTPDYNKLDSFIAQINTMIPTLAKIVSVFAPDQEEYVISIKLPDNIKNFDELNEFNNRISGIFAKIGITEKNGLTFRGFDNGTEWYQILIDNVGFFKWVVVVIGIAWSCIKIRKDWFDSEISRLTLKSLKEAGKDNSKLDQKDEVVKKVLDVKISEDISTAIDQGLETFGKKKIEVKTQLENAVSAVIDEIDLGTEFHLSLNPPKDIAEIEENGLTEINYSQVYKISSEQDKELKEISSGKNTKE